MNPLGKFSPVAALLALVASSFSARSSLGALSAAEPAGGPSPEPISDTYRVLSPIESGNLLLYPVVAANAKSPYETPFLTLDEGLKSGDVEVTEAGKISGLVRPRGRVGIPENQRSDMVNTLVLVNRSRRPLLLLAGEIVTGGKQDRIIAKDRIVPAESDPIDLSVFCIEPGRWTESSATFGASSKSAAQSIMVQPAVRERAMAEQDQQSVWNSVRSAISGMAAATPMASPEATTSYAKTVQNNAVAQKVDEAAAPIMNSRENILAELREQHALGVVVAVHGEIIWADLFANTDLLSRYWTKLVRSYAAESLVSGEAHAKPNLTEAQHFLDASAGSTETSEGEIGVYRTYQVRSGRTQTFRLESLLPGTGYDVHISRMKVREAQNGTPGPRSGMHVDPYQRPEILR